MNEDIDPNLFLNQASRFNFKSHIVLPNSMSDHGWHSTDNPNPEHQQWSHYASKIAYSLLNSMPATQRLAKHVRQVLQDAAEGKIKLGSTPPSITAGQTAYRPRAYDEEFMDNNSEEEEEYIAADMIRKTARPTL